MKILLTGLLPSAADEICVRLTREGHQVSAMGHIRHPERFEAAGIPVHDNLLGQKRLLAFMDASRFQAVVFFFACQSEDMYEYGSAQGALLDDLFAMQNALANGGVERFVLVTDRRVFGRDQACAIDEVPFPDTPTGVLIKAAEDCLRCSHDRYLLIRVSSLYAPGDTDSFFAHVNKCAQTGRVFHINGSPDSRCDFLRADDLGVFISRALENKLSGVVHVTYGVDHAYREVAALMSKRLAALRVDYPENAEPAAALKPSPMETVDWVPRHNFAAELDELLVPKARPKRPSLSARLRALTGHKLGKALPWIELILFGLLVWWLDGVTQVNATLRFVDWWLLYVVVAGALYGGWMGVAAAIVALFTYAADWVQNGNQLYLLFYNVDNWLVPVCYLLAGSMFGYIRDSWREKVTALENEKKLSDEETQFIKNLYDQAYGDRNRLLEQVISYRDSYGRIYRITRELDTMQPEQVFLSTLDVVEDTLQNHTVAIYARRDNLPFARLVVHSRAMKNLARSLDLAALPRLKETLDDNRIFVNTALEAGYPAYAAPIVDDKEGLAAIVLWEVPFEKQTLYFENLFNVVAGLVQSALVRALNFFNASGDMYLENTHILNDRAFRAALGVYRSMRKSRTGSYLLVRLHTDRSLTREEYDRRIHRATRSTDVAGCMEDGGYYVLFPQAGVENLPQIEERFLREGIRCEVIAQEVAYG